ncbi:MAG TPA: dihydrodipicolinate synthase family protein [Hyphomicrobiaceae bacterium]|nr:dihydrodipicolinate synthase family protein [Hyphomicrobiaceae bacterium]
MAIALRGVIPILLTPFDEEGRIDVDSLQNLIDFNIAAGVHGLGVALGSEIFKFNEAERDLVTRTVVDHTKGRVPVVINTGAAGTDLAVQYSRAAEAAGADALMVIPPHFQPAGPAEIIQYYKAIDQAVGLPLILQDIPQAPVSPAMAMRLRSDCRNVSMIKVETLPITIRVAEMAAAVGKQLTIFGGAGGTYFIEEMRRGAQGTMPFCSQPAAFVETWNRFQSGDEKGARAAFDKSVMAVNRLAAQGGDLFYHVHKQLLVRLGVIRTAVVRSPTVTLDPVSQREIDELLEQLVAG